MPKDLQTFFANLYIPEFDANTKTMGNEVTDSHFATTTSTQTQKNRTITRLQRKPNKSAIKSRHLTHTPKKTKRIIVTDTVLDDESSGSKIDVDVVPDAEDELGKVNPGKMSLS